MTDKEVTACVPVEIASLAIERKINRSPVVGPEASLVGIMSRADVLRTFVIREELWTIFPK